MMEDWRSSMASLDWPRGLSVDLMRDMGREELELLLPVGFVD